MRNRSHTCFIHSKKYKAPAGQYAQSSAHELPPSLWMNDHVRLTCVGVACLWKKKNCSRLNHLKQWISLLEEWRRIWWCMVHEIVLILNVKQQRRRLSGGQVKVKLFKTKSHKDQPMRTFPLTYFNMSRKTTVVVFSMNLQSLIKHKKTTRGSWRLDYMDEAQRRLAYNETRPRSSVLCQCKIWFNDWIGSSPVNCTFSPPVAQTLKFF